MLKPRVMPCLLLSDGSLVKTVRFKDPGYIGDPINAIRIYNEKEVDELIFLDITATVEDRRPPFDTIAKITNECFMPVAFGGGIRSLEEIKKILTLGIEKVVINTMAFEQPDFITQAASHFGSQAVVVSIDVRKKLLGRYEVFVRSGKKATGIDPVSYAKRVEALGAGEIMLTSIDRDGTQEGYNLDLIRMITHSVNIPVIACGGAGKVSDFGAAIKEGGASACAAGSMVVYYGRNRAVLINFPTREEIDAVIT